MAGLGTEHSSVLTQIQNLPADGHTPVAETLWEAYLYLTGQKVEYGKKSDERDFLAETGTSNNDNNSSYISPFKQAAGADERCDNSINLILMTDGDPVSDSESDGDIKDLFKSVFEADASKTSGSYLAALSQAMHGTKDVEVDLYDTTPTVADTARIFTIGFGSGMSTNGKKLLEKTAQLGGGEYLHADTSEELSDALNNTISRIREINDSFSSPSVASNNVDQTRSRDSVYFPMFYPETGARWSGNLKKLKVSGSNIIDSVGNIAINENGLIDEDARTFWLPTDQPADGNLVAEGGVNLLLSTLDPDSRDVYTDKAGSITKFKASTPDEVLNLIPANVLGLTVDDINWARGVDVDNEDGDNSSIDQRSDTFGDPLHSKPVSIDYGDGNIRILVGTNAGFLHMFKDKGESIEEEWAFIPSSLFKNIKPLRANQAGTKLYGMDGPISVYFNNKSLNTAGLNDGVVKASEGDEVWAFAGMRRGGRNYYALDISTPKQPLKLWDKPIIGGSEEFKYLGQTWSKPQVAYIKAFGNEPLLVFGAGYDINKDNALRSNDSIGRGIYIVKAKTGEKVWALTPEENSFTGEHSIAADVTTLDSNYDGYIDRIYATDTGGNIWRVDMPTDNKDDFTHFKLAELGSTLASQDRRFFYKPLVARTIFSKATKTSVGDKIVTTRLDTPYDAIVIGSGNRSNPLATNEQDQLFMIRDENTLTKSFDEFPVPIQIDDLMKVNDDPFGNKLDDVEGFIDLEVDLGAFKGWRYELSTGEKSLAAATVVGGVAYFTSFTPASVSSTQNQCSLTGGGGSLYAFHLHYGTKVYEDLKFTTSYDVPDTPQLFFGEGPSCVDSNNNGYCDTTSGIEDIEVTQVSKFYLIGPGIEGSNKPIQPIEVLGPNLKVVDGKIELTDKNKKLGIGFNTQQTYIFKREEYGSMAD
jgi:type IV pilus assembly protein PilY1